jgi:hypothetical protein
VRRSVATLVVVALVLAGLAAPATARHKVTVRMTVHLKADYTHTIDYTDDSDPECIVTQRGNNEVVSDMPSDRPSVYTITRLPKGKGVVFEKHLGAPQREDLGVDMHVHMTRSQDGGGTTDCHGFQPFPSDGCNSRDWIIRGEPHFTIEKGHPRLYIVPWETVDTLDKLMADDKWRQLGCGYDGDADSYISQTYSLTTGRIQKGYYVPASCSS